MAKAEVLFNLVSLSARVNYSVKLALIFNSARTQISLLCFWYISKEAHVKVVMPNLADKENHVYFMC